MLVNLWILQEAAARAADDESLTFGEVLADIPHDAGAFTLYFILALSVYAVWWGHRNAGRGDRGPLREIDRPDETPANGEERPKRPTSRKTGQGAGGDTPRRPAA